MDRIPYGVKYAYENLSYLFPHAIIRTSDRFPVLLRQVSGEDTSRALVIISIEFKPDPDEMSSIIRFAASGNQVFISSFMFDDSVMTLLGLRQRKNFDLSDSTYVSLRDPMRSVWVNYIYPGTSSNAYFDSAENNHTTILGKTNEGKPDFIRLNYSHGGAVFLHLDPLAFGNFFLLHKKNKRYYETAFSYLPVQVGVVEWSDYFRYSRKVESFSALRFIRSNRSLRWAFWLILILFLLVFLIESKRKQRPITEIPPFRNASEDFVKTVGRLYFQQKNNQNLAGKMIAAMLENIRSNFNLSTSLLNEEFARSLAFRTGRPVKEIQDVIDFIHMVRMKEELSDQELMELHQQIKQFNKPT